MVKAGFNTEYFDDFPIAIFLLDNKGNFIYINKSAEKLSGYSLKELKGKNFRDAELLKGDDLLSAARGFELEIKGEHSEDREFDLIRKDNSRIPVTIDAHYIRKGHKIENILGIVHDISEKKRSEKALRESEKKYRELFENAGDAIFVADNERNIVDVNDSACRMLGYDKEELCRLKVEDLYYHHPGRELLDDQLRLVMEKGPAVLKIAMKRKDSGKVDVHLNAKLTSRRPFRVMGIAKDVTEEKKLMNRIKKIESEKIGLTEKEKLVFYGVARWPEINDSEMSEKIRIKRSTVTAIRNKLKKEGFFRTIRIPSPHILGGKYLKIHKHKFVRDYPGCVYILSSETDSLFISVEKEFPGKSENHVNFEIGNSCFARIFDFSCLLKNLFEINIDHRKEFRFREKGLKLTKKEKLILYALVKYPDLTDSGISEMTDSARATISKLRKKLLSENYLKTVIVPDLKKLGLKIFIATHLKHMINSKRAEEILKLAPNTFFMVLDSKDAVMLSAYRNYSDYKKIFNSLFPSWAAGGDAEKPDEIVIPVSSVKKDRIKLAEITRSMLKIRRKI